MEVMKDISIASWIFLIIAERSWNRPVSLWLHVPQKVYETVQLANLSVHAAVEAAEGFLLQCC